MSFECVMSLDPFDKNSQMVNVLISVTSVHENNGKFSIDAEVKNAETAEVIKQIATNFAPVDVKGDLKTQAVYHLRSMFFAEK